MNTLKNTGLGLFLTGFAIFLSSFFLTEYQVTNQILKEEIDQNEKRKSFRNYSGEILQKPYSNSVVLVSALDEIFKLINQNQLTKYSLSESQVTELSNAAVDGIFQLEAINSLFEQSNPVQKYQLEAFKSYGSWLDGRTYNEPSDLRVAIDGVNANIRKYGILSDKGFDAYEIKDLKYSIVKAASTGAVVAHPILFLLLTYGLCIVGGLLYIIPNIKLKGPSGIKNDGVQFASMSSRGWLGIFTGTFLIVFYVVLYFYPEYMTPWITMVDPVSYFLKGSEGGRFFLYGFLYTLTILVMGVRMLIKYRHSKYQIFRTFSVMVFQTSFAFLIPEFLLRLNQPYFDFKNIWPLDYDFFFDNELSYLIESGSMGIFMLGWGIALILVAVPVMVYFFGKRWYCSWVCGCGGLAETLGDPYRQLSDKSLKAWKVERFSIHGVLIFAIAMTAGVLYTYWSGHSELFGVNTYQIRSVYGAWIGAGFAGVVGTGFYPLMGNRVWCRFGCPLAAYLGLVQRFKSRFRITTNGGQCISCGNCSTYCEMGIDVRWYAQRGENIIRSSCVGCGVCSSVCPRGVLNLENRTDDNRFEPVGLIGNNSFDS